MQGKGSPTSVLDNFLATWRASKCHRCCPQYIKCLVLCRERIAARAQPLHEANVTVEVFPLTPPGETFGMAFWNHIIHAGDDEESGAQYEEGSDTMYRLQARPGSSTLPACLASGAG